MAKIPTPRSQQQILGDMIDTFKVRTGVTQLKPGPMLSVLEVASLSDTRNTQDQFQMLAAISLDSATGTALDRIGNSEGVPRQRATAANGKVTISDSSITKISTKIYHGSSAPLSGATTIYVTDASLFPANGQLYIGRGTSNLEGPLSYSTPVSLGGGAYWSLTISGGTQKYHNLGESVVLAQGGDRLIQAGQVVSTPQGNASEAVSFSTTSSATILDGEVSVEGVPVVCQDTGSVGNVPAGAIKSVTAPAFTGMAVTNPLPLQNALDEEKDEDYRERIKVSRQTKSRGTRLAITSGVLGITADDEPSRITSSSIVRNTGEPSILYIDDGTGYEEKVGGVAIESVVDVANGGERYFQLAQGRPVAKAFLKSEVAAPFALQAGSTLAVAVGGVRSAHTFTQDQFRDISAASAYEVVAAINANPELLFSARTTAAGSQVSLVAKTETNEDLEVLDGGSIDANDVLGFPSGKAETLKLYKNDILLYKDGLPAVVTSNPTSSWKGFAENDTLVIDVDSTGAVTYSFSGSDFSSAGTGYTAVSEANSLEAWAAVLNRKVPGITATPNGSSLLVSSNLGRNSRASVSISASSTLVGKGMFNPEGLSAKGADIDYKLDRNLGQIKLSTALQSGDALGVGSKNTRAYIESDPVSTITMASGKLWFAVDGNTEIISTGLSPATYLKLTVSASTPVKRFTAYSDAGLTVASYAFGNVKLGDWIIAWDPAFSAAAPSSAAAHKGVWKVSNVDPLGQWIEIDTPPAAPPGAPGYYTLTNLVGGIVVARTSANVQEISFGAATYGPGDIVTTLNSQLVGATAATFRTNKVRVATNTYAGSGEIALITADQQGQLLPFDLEVKTNSPAHVATVESGNSEVGTPTFAFSEVTAYPASKTLTLSTALASLGGTSNSQIAWARSLPTSTVVDRYGSNTHDHSSIEAVTTDVKLRRILDAPVVQSGATYTGDRVFPVSSYGFGPNDELNVVLDRDEVSKNFNLKLARNLVSDTLQPYGGTIRLKDQDNLDGGGSPKSIASAFGTGFNFQDFALFMKARTLLDQPAGGGAPTSDLVLMRFGRFGPEGNKATVAYGKPTGPATSLTVTATAGTGYDILVNLPAGAARSVSIDAAQRFAAFRVDDGGLSDVSHQTYFCGVTVSQLARVGTTVTVTVTYPNADVSDHMFQTNDQVYITSTDVNFPSGFKTVTRINASQFSYTEAGAATTVNPANSYAGWSSNVINFASGVSAGDYVDVSSTTSLPAAWRGINYVESRGIMFFKVICARQAAGSTGYAAVNTTSAIKFFPVDQSVSGTGATPPTAAQIETAVNALTSGIVSAKAVVSPYTGTISKSSFDNYALGVGLAPKYSLVDGVNYISLAPYNGGAGTYDLTLKNAVSAVLTTAASNDYANEKFKLIPTTTKNLVDYIGVGGVTGFTLGGGAVARAKSGDKLQISSATVGSGGSVEIQGGLGNSSSAYVVGSAQISGSSLVAQTLAPDTNGLFGGQWVSIDNSSPLPKTTGWGASTTLAIDSATGSVTVAGGAQAWDYAGSMTSPVVANKWSIERHGNFTAFVSANDDQSGPAADFSTVKENDVVVIPQANGSWSPTGSVSQARSIASATLLQDGTVLVVSGGTPTGVCEIFDPDTGVWTATDAMPVGTERTEHAAVLLKNGQVLISGGKVGGTASITTYLYNPSAAGGAKWTAGPAMVAARAGHTATLMLDGSVLIAGGMDAAGNSLNSAEIYYPSDYFIPAKQNTFITVTSTMGNKRYNHTATLMDTGAVLLVGGADLGVTAALNSADIYSPASGSIQAAAAPGAARTNHSAVKLPNGKVLVVGGENATATTLNTAQTYDSSTNTWSSAATSLVARKFTTAVLLDDGDVLVAGGISTGTTALNSAERYNYTDNAWTYTGGFTTARGKTLVAKLTDGRVLACGGQKGGSNLSTVELYDPEAGISAVNAGTFRIVRILWDAGTKRWAFWVENPSSLEERVSVGHLTMLDRNSVLPGDKLSIGSTVLGTDNKSVWTVNKINPIDTSVFYLQGTPTTKAATALGAEYGLVQVIPSAPARLIKKIQYVGPHPSDTSYSDVAFTTTDASDLVTSAAGSKINALDKLAFPTTLSSGRDGYSHNTGLIAEAIKVVYGDEVDPITYPGIAADGSTISIQGPTVRRIKVSLAVRIDSGDFADVRARIQGLVAAVINGTGVGGAISISDIVSAASQASGVVAVSVIYPTYTSSSDQIRVQPYEKPMVLDLDTDVLVSQVGV